MFSNKFILSGFDIWCFPKVGDWGRSPSSPGLGNAAFIPTLVQPFNKAWQFSVSRHCVGIRDAAVSEIDPSLELMS